MTDVFDRLQESELIYYSQSSKKDPFRVQESQCWCTVTWNELGHSFTCDDWSRQYLLWENLGRWSLPSDLGIYGCPRMCAFGHAPEIGHHQMSTHTCAADCVVGVEN